MSYLPNFGVLEFYKIITILCHSSLRKEICENLIAQLYLRFPRIITLLQEIQVSVDLDKSVKTGLFKSFFFFFLRVISCSLRNNFYCISVLDRESSVLDVMSHSILTSFTTNFQIKDSPKRTQELEMIIRKMASSHPRLILRYRVFATCQIGSAPKMFL